MRVKFDHVICKDQNLDFNLPKFNLVLSQGGLQVKDMLVDTELGVGKWCHLCVSPRTELAHER